MTIYENLLLIVVSVGTFLFIANIIFLYKTKKYYTNQSFKGGKKKYKIVIRMLSFGSEKAWITVASIFAFLIIAITFFSGGAFLKGGRKTKNNNYLF